LNPKFMRNGLLMLVLVMGISALLYTWLAGSSQPNAVGWGSFLDSVSKGEVGKVVQQDTTLTVTEAGSPPKTYTVHAPGVPGVNADYLKDIQAAAAAGGHQFDQAKYSVDPAPDNSWIGLVLTGLLPLIIIGGFIYFMMRQAQGTNNQALSFGKSRARMFLGNKQVVTFNDVAGVDEAKTELQEVVEFLKYPEKFNTLGARIPRGVLLVGPPGTGKTLMARAVAGVDEAKQELTEVVEFLKYPEKFNSLGARIPRGVLLVGPPGTGKTMLARAVAGEAGVPFFSISGSEFVEMFVGVGASRVRDLFDQAKRNAPCIVFIDEIDAVGRQRGAGLGGSHDEREQTLNQILVEMDGFDTGTNVIVVAATNRPDVLDPALLRPGRFDRQVVLDRPDIKGRKAILDVHVRGKPLDKNVDLLRIGQISPGFSGADLANVVNEAAILAARRNKKMIGQIDFEEALEKVALGPERRSRVITEKEKWIVAYHEAGHALCFKLLKHTNPVHKISVVARGMAMGVTWSLPQEDRYFRTRKEFEDDIAAALGGWVAEQLHLGGDATTGASNDIEKATEMARQMVTKFGMSEKLGPLQYGKTDELIFLGRQIQEERNYSEDVAKIIDSEVHDIVDRARQRAYEVLTNNRDKLDLVVSKLIEQETLESDEFNKLFDGESDSGVPVAASTPDQPPPGAPAGEERRREKNEKGKGPAPAPTPA
jgi:cell division protease FtsH